MYGWTVPILIALHDWLLRNAGVVTVHSGSGIFSVTVMDPIIMVNTQHDSGLGSLVLVGNSFSFYLDDLLLHRSSGAFPLVLSLIRIFLFLVISFRDCLIHW